MEVSFTQKQVAGSFRRFNDFASDVFHSDFHTFDTRFDIFIHHCENDDVMKVVTSQLKGIDVHFKDWWERGQATGGSFAGSKEFHLPVDEIERDALLYQLILKIHNREIEFSNFCMDYFRDTNYDLMIQNFNSAILIILVRSIGYRLEEILEAIKTDLSDRQDVPITMLFVYQNNPIHIGNGNVFSGDSAIGGGAKIEKGENE
jgi:hypothetical protein